MAHEKFYVIGTYSIMHIVQLSKGFLKVGKKSTYKEYLNIYSCHAVWYNLTNLKGLYPFDGPSYMKSYGCLYVLWQVVLVL